MRSNMNEVAPKIDDQEVRLGFPAQVKYNMRIYFSLLWLMDFYLSCFFKKKTIKSRVFKVMKIFGNTVVTGE